MSNTDLTVFRREGVDIRTVVVDGEPFFVGADVTTALGYKNGRDAIARHVSATQKGVSRFTTPSGEQDLTILSEAGVYRLVMRSNNANAVEFQDWLAGEVIPSIRKTGSYSVEQSEDEIVARALQITSRRLHALEAKVQEDAPKVEAYERFMDSSSLIKIEVAARQAGVGRTTAYRLLREAHVLQRWSKSPMQPYARRFQEVVSTHENSQGEAVADYTTKVRAEHFDWLVSLLARLAHEGQVSA